MRYLNVSSALKIVFLKNVYTVHCTHYSVHLLKEYLEINLRQKAREDVLLRNYYDAFLQKYITFFPVISVITMIKYQGRI